jgi:spectinomycin phosphotransferase
VFTREEWASFVEGYRQHVQLTDQERRVWEDLLVCAWVDEALWLLSHDAEGWHNPRQANLLLSLLTTEVATLSLT